MTSITPTLTNHLFISPWGGFYRGYLIKADIDRLDEHDIDQVVLAF